MAYISFQPKDFFNTFLHTGNDASPRSFTGMGFQPDILWLKRRNSASSHTLYDAVRTAGSAKGLASNATAAEGLSATEGTTANYGYVSSLDSDGFSVTTGASNDNYVNNSGDTYVSWNWKTGTTSGITTNGSTTITPSGYSFNSTVGVSILTYQGNGTAGAKLAHGLGGEPDMFIIKQYNGANDWVVYFKALSNTQVLYLNADVNSATRSNAWNNTSPDSVNITLGQGGGDINYDSSRYYSCFAMRNVTGFSKAGKYIGNGDANGTFVYTGFKPSWLMIKKHGASSQWLMIDNKRGYNGSNELLYADSSEASGSAEVVDLLSNGFKQRSTGSGNNNSGSDYFYVAFAEAPLVGSNNIPATAR